MLHRGICAISAEMFDDLRGQPPPAVPAPPPSTISASASAGRSYGESMPVKLRIAPARAFA